MELAGKTVVLTGASRGIGRALSVRLARQGGNLLLSALEADELAAVVEEIRSEYAVEVTEYAADITDAGSRADLVEWIKSQSRSPDVLINNAGGGLFGTFEGLDWATIENQLLLNVHASTHLTHGLLPVLQGRPEARIVNISSAIARLPYPGLAVYGAAKGFVSSFSESLACELSGTAVSVLCFHPGFTETSFIASARMDMSGVPKALLSSPDKVAARIIAAIRSDRQWDYGDMATRLSVFLSSFIPPALRISLFKNLFWSLPRES